MAAGVSGSSACAHGVPPSQLTSADEQQSASWPAMSPLGARVTSPRATNVVFAGVKCCSAGPGFDLASGLGSPLAEQIAVQLKR